jgi:hypothetical protein
MKLKETFITFLFLLCSPVVFSFSPADSLLHELSQTLENKDTYIQEKQQRIDRLREILSQGDLPLQQEFNINNTLYHEYQSFKFDSAYTYAVRLQEIARRLDDPAQITYARLKLSFTLLSSGMFKETFDSLNTMEVAPMPDSLKAEYYVLKSRAYHDLEAYNADHFYAAHYLEQGNKCLDSAMALLDKSTLDYHYLSGMKHMKERNLEAAKRDFQRILDQ